ncbi:unnamed protein product [Didymodactylos carnosus]|uniref:NAD(P)(+)--arginine ADP-ribosyltransferase n=1 Tax=Didymodactylos carnosus TaxID=1234261 RepID=A0A814KZG5_9BILA|nr:unnamed protein product [Didymodactylos carnosus]CAF1274388.1 unnamed protein product [Didymodactylos carnosus]CAF3827550.1 unnamed protein product [Didymodactylos carnosus]CAF4079547.1 unnamed protein product [Didymodactylos carnosus]
MNRHQYNIYSMEFDTSEGSLFYSLNRDLRSESRNALKKWLSYLKLFIHALFKLPSTEGTVWRGVNGDVSSIYKIGKRLAWWGVSSTARNVSDLECLQYLDKHGQLTLFCIQCKNGKSIAKHSYFPLEDEVLLMPGTYLEVIGQLQPAEGVHIINLKELDLPYTVC